MPEEIREIAFFAGGQTLIHPFTLALTLGLGVSLLVVPRRWALLPLCVTACFVPMQHRIVLGGLDFDMGRIMILFGWARVFLRKEHRQLTPTSLDKVFVTWLGVGTLFYCLRVLSIDALIFRAGALFDGLGMLFLCRMLVRDHRDVLRTIEIMCWIAVLMSPFLVYESQTGHNLFSVLGGVNEYSVVRNGRVRAQGAFAHPIMAGAVGATLFPLAIALWRARPANRLTAAAGVGGSMILTLAPASSGPLLAGITAAIGWGLWSVRRYMRHFRWSGLAMIVVLHFIREKPVWHLIGRASDFFGGTGWHRYALIDAFINGWREWILVGTDSTAGWGWGLEDLTNQFVLEGVNGGLVTLIAFIALVVASFVSVSRVLRRAAVARWLPREERRAVRALAWGLGVAMAAHCTSWISVSYFGQTQLILYLHLALIAALQNDPALGLRVVRERRSARTPERRRSGRREHGGRASPREPAA